MFESVPDLVVGSIFFVLLLVAAVAAGSLLQGAAKRRHRRALAPLASVLGGVPHSDHKSGWLHGQYDAWSVRVTITPGQNIGVSSEDARRINAFELVFAGIEGAGDWRVAREGLLRQKWVTTAPDAQLRERLAGTDLVSRLAATKRQPALRYDARQKTLTIHLDVRPRLAPKPEELRSLLALMAQAADINAAANPPRP